MAVIDLNRVITLIRRRPIKIEEKRRLVHDVRGLSDWIAAYGREPMFLHGGPRIENALALRLHVYACMLASADGLPQPPCPTLNAGVAPIRRRAETMAAVVGEPVVVREGYDQTEAWS